MKKITSILVFVSFISLGTSLLSSCKGSQSTKIIGVWEMTFMDRLPLGLPRTQWEFTADSRINQYRLPENNIRNLVSTGQYNFTKGGRMEIFNFDKGRNGEWIIVKLNNSVLRMVLKEYVNDQPAGQSLLEFRKIF